MIVRVTRRERTDRHGGMIDRVRAYLTESGARRERESARERPEAEAWESVANVQDYVRVLEGIMAGVSVSAYHLHETRRRYHAAVARLEARMSQHARSYVAATSVYVVALERVAVGEDAGELLDVLRHNYQQSYATVCREGV